MKPDILEVRDGKIVVKVRYNPVTVDLLRDQIDERKQYVADQRLWVYPLETMVVERLRDIMGLQDADMPEEMRTLLPKEAQPRPVDMSVIDGYEFPKPPLEHQRRGLAELIQNDRWLLAWEMGAMKSFVVCNRILFGFQRGHFNRVLIACPKSIVFVWEDELKKHVGLTCFTALGTVLQKKKAIKQAMASERAILVINYDSLASVERELATFCPEMVVADESQALKCSTTIRSKTIRRIAVNARRRYCLSGTPAPQGPLDFFGTLLFFGPEYAGTSYKTAFEARYAIKQALPNGGRVVVAYQNMDDLNRRIVAVSSRVLKKDCLDLPEKTFVERRCALSGEQARVYQELKKDAVARLIRAREDSTLTVRNILSESVRLLQCVGGFLPDDSGEMHAFEQNAKMNLLEETLDEVGDKPVVIWFSFRQELHNAATFLTKRGRRVRCLHGDTSDDDRKKAVQDFQAGEADVFLGMTVAGGAGITLTASDTAIHYSRGFRWDTFAQSSDRVHRYGQHRPVTIISLVAAGTVDERVTAALTRKEKWQDELLSRPVEEML